MSLLYWGMMIDTNQRMSIDLKMLKKNRNNKSGCVVFLK